MTDEPGRHSAACRKAVFRRRKHHSQVTQESPCTARQTPQSPKRVHLRRDLGDTSRSAAGCDADTAAGALAQQRLLNRGATSVTR